MKLFIFALLVTLCLAEPSFLGSKARDNYRILADSSDRRLQEVVKVNITDNFFAVLNITNTTGVVKGDGVEYFGNLLLEDKPDETILINISVLVKEATNQIFINALNYVVLNTNNSTNSTNVDSNSTNSTSSSNTTTVDNNNGTSVDNSTTTSNSTNNSVPTTTADGYTILNRTQVEQDAQISGALLFGINTVIQTGVSQNKVPNTTYNMTDLLLAGFKNQARRVSYTFEVKLLNTKYVHLDANFTVSYDSSSKAYKLSFYHYHTYNYTNDMLPNPTKNNNSSNNTNTTTPGSGSNTTTPSNTTNASGNSGASNTTNSTTPVTPVSGNNSTSNANSTNNSSSSNNSTSSSVTSDGYTILSLNQVNQDNQTENALLYGIAAIIDKAVSQNKAPNTTYSMSNLVSANYKNQSGGVSYRFQVALINAKYAHIDANLTVAYKKSDNSYKLTSYSFRTYNYSNKDLPNNNANNSSNSTLAPPVINTNSTGNNNSTNTTGSTGTNNSTVSTNSTTPSGSNSTGAGSSANSTNSTVSGNNSTNSTSTNSTTISVINQTSPDGYTFLNVTQVQLNSTFAGFINFGTAYVLKKGADQNKIPNTTFALTNLTSFSYKELPKGINYNVTAIMKNADNVTVGMNFTEYYKNSNQNLTVMAYNYTVNYPKKLIGKK